MSENYYINYQNMVTSVTTALADLEKICEQLKLTEKKEELERIQKKLSSHTFSVGIMGEFKRGKSTVINSLLEKEIMPADILPCSATMNRVTYDLQPHVELRMKDGNTKDIAVEELVSYVTKLNAENESRAAEVEEAIVYYPCRFCKNGVDIVDTPGLNDDERMNKISEEVIPKLDAVIMVLTPDNPFSMSEAEFVRNKILASDLGRLIFVVNKMDTIRRASDRERVIEGIREKIEKSVMEKMANLYGEGSPEYEDAVKKIGKIRIYPLSAIDALDGKIEGNQELIDQSGTVQFEEAMTKMLTEDRGALELSSALTVIARTAVEISKTINVRRQALDMNAKEFEENQQQALVEIKKIREDKMQEKFRLKTSARETNDELAKMIDDFYPELQASLLAKVDQAASEIDIKQLESDAGLKAVEEQLRNVVKKESQDQISLFTEKLKNRLEQQIGKELVKTGTFMNDVSEKLDFMNASLFTKKKGSVQTDILAAGAEMLSTLSTGVAGVGGLITGYQNAGLKGALVGGGIGFGATLMAMEIALGLAVTGPVVLLACTLAGTLAGKFGTKFIFRKDIGKKKLEEMKSGLEKGIQTLIQELKKSQELEKWCKKAVQDRFDELIIRMEEEMERLLKSTEMTMDEIKHDLTENEVQRKQLDEKFDKMLKSVEQITEKDLEPVITKVQAVLETM